LSNGKTYLNIHRCRMPHVTFRFYAELNDHLPRARRQVSFIHAVEKSATVQDAVESLGVPAGQIDLVLVNGESAGLHRTMHDSDYLSLFPVFESFDIAIVSKVRDKPLRTPRFVLDVHLGKLAHYLRMLGFDSVFNKDADDDSLMIQSREEGRTLLSKDRRLLQREEITRKYDVREIDSRLQLIEVLDRFDLYRSVAPFIRCMECNTLLIPVGKEEVRRFLPPNVQANFHNFQLCPTCERVYWKGSHYERMKQFIDGLMRHRSTGDAEGDAT
jgi:uncharacterized protein with PIN domain